MATVFPNHSFSAWINPTGDTSKPLTRCINVFSDDSDKVSEMKSVNKDVPPTIWREIASSFRCETGAE